MVSRSTFQLYRLVQLNRIMNLFTIIPYDIKPLSKQRWFHPLPMHPRWRPGCATSPIQFQGQFRLLECAADGGILSGAYQCCKKCTPFDAQLTRFYIRVIRVRDVKWSAWQQLNYLRWISQSVSPLIILSLAGRSDQKNKQTNKHQNALQK